MAVCLYLYYVKVYSLLRPYAYIFIYMYTHMYISIYIHIYICIHYICIYMYIYPCYLEACIPYVSHISTSTFVITIILLSIPIFVEGISLTYATYLYLHMYLHLCLYLYLCFSTYIPYTSESTSTYLYPFYLKEYHLHKIYSISISVSYCFNLYSLIKP